MRFRGKYDYTGSVTPARSRPVRAGQDMGEYVMTATHAAYLNSLRRQIGPTIALAVANLGVPAAEVEVLSGPIPAVERDGRRAYVTPAGEVSWSGKDEPGGPFPAYVLPGGFRTGSLAEALAVACGHKEI